MNKEYWLLKAFKIIGLTLLLGVSLTACGADSTEWKEEVLLHDGSKIMVTRSQTRGGRHEAGQRPSVKEHTIAFKLPNSDTAITFKSEYGEDVGRANFNLLALHILNGTPYLVTEPNLCLSYNKWGRPNPPYVFFKYDGEAWQRIPLSAFPTEFKNFNLIINNGREGQIKKAESNVGYVTAENVNEFNSSLTQPEYKAILHQALPQARINQMCMEMIRVKDGWVSPGGAKAPTPIAPQSSSDINN